MQSVLEKIAQSQQAGRKLFAVLIDPDKFASDKGSGFLSACQTAGVDFVFVGGSLLTDSVFSECIGRIKGETDIPVVIFPGNIMQIDGRADAILFLSLISGRNADMLIGKHVLAAPLLKKTSIEVIPTGYMLIESGKLTTAAYISNTVPIPGEKADIAACTAMAGEMLGLRMMFLDAGSGAITPVSEAMISKVRSAISTPLIVGGGIKTPEKALANCRAGADVIVVGNAIENTPALIQSISEAIHGFNK